MPLLEQRRRARGDAPDRRGRVPAARLRRLADLSCRHWPPAWALLFLLASSAGAAAGGAPWPGWTAAGRAAVCAPLLLGAPGHRIRLLAWAVAAAGAAWWGQGEAASRTARRAALAPGPLAPSVAAAWRGPAAVRVTGHPTATAGDGWRVPVLLLAAGPGEGPVRPRRGEGAWLRGRGTPPPCGSVATARCELAVPPRADVPGGFDLRAFLAGRGLAWTGRVLADSLGRAGPADAVARLAGVAAAGRAAAVERLDALLPPREAGLAAAVLLGRRTPTSRADAADFTALGLAHLFAVSGLHVGVLAGLLLLPAGAAGAGRAGRAAVLLAAVPGFVAVTGAPGSVVRAGAVVVLAALAPACGRRPDGPRLLGLVFWAVAAWDPATTLDTGARLSYLAAGGIVAASALTGGFAAPGPRPLRAAAAGLGVSLAAQWATLPVVASAFGRLNLLAPLANLAAVPVFALAVWLLAAALAAAPLLPWAAEALAAWAWLLLRALAAGAAGGAGPGAEAAVGLPVPGPPQVAAWIALTIGLVAVARSPLAPATRALAAAAILAAGVTVCGPAARDLPPRHAPAVVQFAVGQGDCAVVVFPDGWTAVIDAADAWRGGSGPWEREVTPWLRRQGVRRLDAVILTHGHRDHTGGAEVLGRAWPVGRWLGGGRAGADLDTGPAAWLRPGPATRVLHRWDDWRLEVLDPAAAGGRAADENDRSLAAVLRQGDRARVLWTGDLEVPGEAALLAAGLVPAEADVWKAGHHGSATSGSGPFLAAARPGLVVVSCGVDNRHGHPSHGPYVAGADTLPVLRTDLHGTVRLDWPTGHVRVRTRRGGPP